jgi:hypothetical protein
MCEMDTYDQVWSTNTLQPIYIIHPCDDTAGDVYSLAWDSRAGGTLYLGKSDLPRTLCVISHAKADG